MSTRPSIAGMGLEEMAKAIEDLRTKALFDEDGPVLGPMSEQYYLLALGALEQAQRFAQLAHYYQIRKD